MVCINSVKRFEAREGAPFKNEDAQVIGETLDNIRKKYDGFFKNDLIVEEAKKKSNPLHKHFEWDNNVCGEKFRLQQARNITNHIVEVLVINGNPTTQRSFHSVISVENEPVYVSLQDAIETVDFRLQLLNKMITTMENLTTTMKLFKTHDYK